MGQSLICRRLYGSRKEEASFADGRLNALTLCLLESFGVRHAVVGAMSALNFSSDAHYLTLLTILHID